MPTSDELKEILEDAEQDKDRQHWTGQAAQKDIRKLIEMAAERQMEALNLYEPTPIQERYHACRAKELIFSKGNQTGGSLAGFAEDARAATGADPYDKYPKKNGILVCLGYGEKHIGTVIHKYLCRWGAFEIIRDERRYGLWRTFRPWDKSIEVNGKFGDGFDRQEEARPAPPLIPARFIEDIAWQKKGQRVFSIIRLTTGWEILAYNSQGESEHAQGFQCDLWHIDEDVATDGWVAEAIGRLSRRKGLLRWTAMPRAKTEDIVGMIKRAEDEEKTRKNPRTVVIYAGIDDNPYLPEETKEENKRIWRTMGEEEYMRRVSGKLVIAGLRMYPQFDEKVHGARMEITEPERVQEQRGRSVRSKVHKIMTESKGVPPADWTRYVSIDPGYSLAAGVFGARPPASVGDFMVIYKELYIPNCTASIFADAMRKVCGPDEVFEEFIFDFHGGRLRDLGRGEQPVEVWEREFARNALVCNARGSRFVPGYDNIEGREAMMREALMVRNRPPHAGYPRLLVDVENCPNLVNEIKAFRKKVVKVHGRDVVTDKGERRMTHAVEAAEMLVATEMPYVKPPSGVTRPRTIADRILGLKKELQRLADSQRTDNMDGIVLGPRGSKD